MWIPLIIAILMGLVCPTNNNSNSNSGTVYVSNTEPNGDDPGDPGDPGDGDEDGGTDGPGSSGDTGQNPPPKP